MALIDLTGQVFERLTVLYRDTEYEKQRKDRHAIWRCKCVCGNEVSVVGKDLRRGATKSCGCLQRERTSQANGNKLIGQRFGKLVVKSQAQSKNKRTYWNCLCDCGNEVVVCARELQRGDTESCGCLYSKGEAKICKILNSLRLEYKKEFSFSDLRTEYDLPQRFDFAIFQEEKLICLIEYDGKQHYMNIGGWDTEISYQIRKKRDLEKNKYCEKNNIPLIRIPYTDYTKINEEYIKERIKECQLIADLQ